jgi:hypothetical protein
MTFIFNTEDIASGEQYVSWLPESGTHTIHRTLISQAGVDVNSHKVFNYTPHNINKKNMLTKAVIIFLGVFCYLTTVTPVS